MRTLVFLVIALAATAANATDCFLFNGQKYCPVASEVAEQPRSEVQPCRSTSCLVPDYWNRLPKPEVKVIEPRVTAVVAPTDAAGAPAAYVNTCSQYGCTVSKAPVVAVEIPPSEPPKVFWYQPGPVAVPTVIFWGPQLGYGPWGLPSGPPLRRR